MLRFSFFKLLGAAVLVVSLVPLSQPFRHRAAWRVPAEDARHVERALSDGAAAVRVSREDYRALRRPRVDRDRDRTCVTLATYRDDGGGNSTRCYENRSGALISVAERGMPFGSENLWNRFGHWIW